MLKVSGGLPHTAAPSGFKHQFPSHYFMTILFAMKFFVSNEMNFTKTQNVKNYEHCDGHQKQREIREVKLCFQWKSCICNKIIRL